jgi:uncharacterized membrane protein
LRLQVSTGDFVRDRTVMLCFWAERAVDDGWDDKLRGALSIGAQRSYEDDIGFGLDQLGLIATRSLSPAINAVGTAQDAIARLIASFVRLGNRKIPSPYHRDDQGRLRVVEQHSNFQHILSRVLDPMRSAASANPAVMIRIIRDLTNAIPEVANPEIRDAMVLELEKFTAASGNFSQESDRRQVREIESQMHFRRIA